MYFYLCLNSGVFAFPKLLRTRKTSIQERVVFVADTPAAVVATDVGAAAAHAAVTVVDAIFNFAAVVRVIIVVDVAVIIIAVQVP